MLTSKQLKEATVVRDAMMMLEIQYPELIPSHISDYYHFVVQELIKSIRANNKQKIREIADPYLTSKPLFETLIDTNTVSQPISLYIEMFRHFVTSLTPFHFRLDIVSSNPEYNMPKEYLAKGLLKVVK